MRKPDGITMQAARQCVRGIGSAMAADFNHYYRPGQGPAACQGSDCQARQMIAWPAPQGECLDRRLDKRDADQDRNLVRRTLRHGGRCPAAAI